MKNTTVVTDFKDLRKAIEEITKNQPAETRYQQQAKKMGYTKDKTVVVEQSISEASAFDDMKDIVKTKGAKKIGGVMVDMFTASVITKAYDKVNDANKKKMEKANVQTLVKLAHKVMGLNASHEFDKTPLKGFPFNEVVEDTEIQEWISKNGVRRRVSERDKRKLKEHSIDESKMGDLLIDIQQGATAKELARDHNIPLSVAKNFLKDYYGQKKGSRKEEVEESVNESNWGFVFYNKKSLDNFLKDPYIKSVTKNVTIDKAKFRGGKSGFDVGIESDADLGLNPLAKKVDAIKKKYGKPGVDYAHVEHDGESISEGTKLKDVMRKHGRELKKVSKSNNLELSKKAEDDLMTWALNSGEIRTDDPDEFDQWLDNNIDDLVKGKIKEENIQEGTWAVPDSYKKLYNLQVGFLQTPSKPNTANAKRMAKNIYDIFGDDGFFDDLLRVELGKEGAETDDLRNLIVKHLEPWGLKFKKGATYKITHAPQKWLDNMTANPVEDDSVEESAKKRKSGNLKPTGLGRSMKVDLKANWAKEDKLDPVGKGDDDIDNDGDSDDSDDYLRNRRKKISKAMKMKEANQNAKRSPFKLKSQSYPRAVGIETEGYGTRHASREDIVEACDSFGMITEQELQLEQLQKTLGKSGFLTYNISELNDIFDERETERMILAMESIIPDEKLTPIEYLRVDIDKALDEELEVEFVKPDGMKAVGPVLKMCENTYNLKDKHTGKSFTFKYKDEGSMKTFNEVIAEAKFPKKLVRQAGGIAFDKRYVGGNMTGAVNAIEKLKKGLSDDPKVRDMLRLANESFNNEFYNALSENEKSEYQKFFMSALKKFGVNSPGELEGEKEKDFYNYVDKNWKGKGEKKESVEEGKYSAYSDLLVMKARIIDKEGPKSDKLPAVDSQIRIVMKRLGVKENDTHPSKVKVDGRRTNFREKMRKLGYIKNQY